MASSDSFELESTDGTFAPKQDKRPRMPQPLPVRIFAVNDVLLPAPPGIEPKLDEFYVDLLGFLRDTELPLAYQSENFRVIFEIQEQPIERDSYRVLQIEIESFREMEPRLIEAEIEYARQRGLLPGTESLQFQDPAGSWIELVERRRIL